MKLSSYESHPCQSKANYQKTVKNTHLSKSIKSPPKTKCLAYMVECSTCSAILPQPDLSSHSCLEYLTKKLTNEQEETESIKRANLNLNSEIEQEESNFKSAIASLHSRLDKAKVSREEIHSNIKEVHSKFTSISQKNEKAVESELASLEAAQDLLVQSRVSDTSKEINWLLKNFTEQIESTFDRARFKVAEFGAEVEVDLDEKAMENKKFQKIHTRTLSL